MTKPKRGKKRTRKPAPLAPPPAMRSRKRARVVTTLFHRHTRERDEALDRGDEDAARRCEEAIEGMGGREAYQSASRLSTSHFSTSRWVLGALGVRGWLQGVPVQDETETAELERRDPDRGGAGTGDGGQRKRKVRKREINLLEVGAINRELLDAAARTRRVNKTSETGIESESAYVDEPVYRLNVRAIDLRSSLEGIEEADFLRLPLMSPGDPSMRYDAIVCSMVINCVTTPEDRGRMLALLYHQLRPGGICFLTLPRLCLIQSKYTTPQLFEEMLTSKGGIGFELDSKKNSPKIAFFVLRRPEDEDAEERLENCALDPKWTTITEVKKGKKFRNKFSVVLDENEVSGRQL